MSFNLQSGLVEYLYGVGYHFSGPYEFSTAMNDRIETLSSEGIFEAVETRWVSPVSLTNVSSWFITLNNWFNGY